MIYREVKASERLPEKEGFYMTIFDTSACALRIFDGRKFNDNKASWWLEPIEITEEDIREILGDYGESLTSRLENVICESHFHDLAKAILSKLKGE